MHITALWLIALSTCATGASSPERSYLLQRVRDTPLIITKVEQRDTQAPDRAEVFCGMGSHCAPFKICTGTREAAEDCTALLQPPAPGARAVIDLGAAVADQDWIWLRDAADQEQWNTRVGPFNCPPHEGRARAECGLAAFGACTVLSFGTSTGT